MIDEQGIFTMSQGDGLEKLGWKAGELIGKSAFEVYQDVPPVLEHIERALEGQAGEGRVEIRGDLWDCRFYPVQAQNGATSGLILIAFDITNHQKLIWAQKSIVDLSSGMRRAGTRARLEEVVVKELTRILFADGALMVTFEPAQEALEVKSAAGAWQSWRGKTLSRQTDQWVAKLSFKLMKTQNRFLVREQNEWTGEKDLDCPFLLGILLEGIHHPLGVIWIGRSSPFQEEEFQFLSEARDLVGNAFQREAQLEQTRRRLSRLTALRNIDRAITSNFDLEVTFNVLLAQVISELGVDAVDVYQYNPGTYSFEFVSGRGFQVADFSEASFNEGEGLVGKVARDRSMVRYGNLAQAGDILERQALVETESFVHYFGMPLIAKGELKGVMEVFHRSPLVVREEWLDFFEALATQAAIAFDNASLIDHVRRFDMELDLVYNATLEGWVRALDLRDKETEGHTQRVTKRTLQLARAMGINNKRLIHIRRGALLHDIGKLGIPDHILNKPGPLSAEEWELMKKHPVYAREMLSQIDFLQPALHIPYCHHEKWDGTGYPRGLAETQIPLEARIFAVIDVWDALGSDRPYREAWPRERVYQHIQDSAGKHFDPQVVKVWRDVFEI
jgi:HD-GYP domain-containing protein (c-di-GMP phosphodiesterase class II)